MIGSENLAKAQRIVVKVGSALVIDSNGKLRRNWLASLCADLAQFKANGGQVILVSSGAIALGARQLRLSKGGRANLQDAQAAAAVGQIALASVWSDLLNQHQCTAAQILLTLADLEDRRRYLNVTATLSRLLALDVIAVINENDSVATEEIRFGDNDRLAARVGQAAQADLVILLSDVDGLYTSDPSRDSLAKRIPHVERIDENITAMAKPSSTSAMGSGGMVAKLDAARIATRAGISLAIASGRFDHPLQRLQNGGEQNRGLQNQTCGTLFVAEGKARARKAWLIGKMQRAGSLTVDNGAAKALLDGKSLLAAGVQTIKGAFQRGDVVDVKNSQGQTIARGLSEYDSREALHIMGLRTQEQEEILGYAPRAALIHRDQMVLL